MVINQKQRPDTHNLLGSCQGIFTKIIIFKELFSFVNFEETDFSYMGLCVLELTLHETI